MLKKLNSLPYAQAYVIIDNEGTHLISYVTNVANIDNDGYLSVNGLYSMTTRKHISSFVNEYTNLDYYDAKKAYEGNYKIHISNSDIIEL